MAGLNGSPRASGFLARRKCIVVLLFIIIGLISLSADAKPHRISRFSRFRKRFIAKKLNVCGIKMKERCNFMAAKCHTSVLTKRSISTMDYKVKPIRRYRRRRVHKWLKRVRISCRRCHRLCW